ncbi:MAG: hypothetical protein JSR82_00365 [Verrucomicrobia bacterium]|nr:hypothetical protein [Verrucomicrobiota bacterium]
MSLLSMLVLGVFFVASGVGKVVDVPGFIEVLKAYGLSGGLVPFLALVVPPAEVLLGLALLTGHASRGIGLLCLLLLIGFTAAFAYAYFGKGVTDCGCFGALEALKTQPMVSFGRNAVLMLLSLRLVVRPVQPGPILHVLQRSSWWLVCALTCAAFTLSGISYASGKLRWGPAPSDVGKSYQNLPIANFAPVGPGSQLVVAFEPNCNSCWNAMENILAFARLGAVEGITGVATGNEEELAEFRRKFNATFPVQLITHELLHEVVGEFPAVWLVRNGRVEREFRKLVPSPYSLNLAPSPAATPSTKPAAPPSGATAESR